MAEHNSQVHWTAPCSIVFWFLSGILAALAHHLYYQSLDKQPITKISQEWAIRIGTGLAFLSKACLGASAALAYQQYLWTILQSHALTVKSIDNVMGLLSDPTSFLSARTHRNAFSCVIIAVVIWCIPLCAIAPPASLTVGDFTSEETIRGDVLHIDWAMFAYIPSGGSGMNFKDTNSETYRTVIASLYTNTILPMTSKYQNSSYSLTFDGPRLRCGKVANQTLFDELNVAGIEKKVASLGSPPKTWYNATVDPPGDHYRFHIFVATLYRNFSCQVWNTTYTVNFSFVNGIQTSDITKVRYLHPLRGDRYYIVTPSYFDTWAIFGYAGWYKALTSILASYAVARNGAYPSWEISTKALQTVIAACPELRDALESNTASSRNECPGGSITQAFEQLSEQATLSFFSSIPKVYEGWTGLMKNMTYTSALITVSTTQLLYSYTPSSLLVSYSVGVASSLLIVIPGLYALHKNGVNHSNSFSGILCTTQNSELDVIAKGNCTGSKPLNEALASQRLQYGLLKQSDASFDGHASFGSPDSVVMLTERDTSYMRLDRVDE